jgi:mono/diheme cytochrome c family protein
MAVHHVSQTMRWAAIACVVGLLCACSPDHRPQATRVDPTPTVQQEKTAVDVAPAVYRGSAIARQVCVRCHDISVGSKPPADVGAPSFVAVANRTGSDELQLWLRSHHPTMPDYVFNNSDIDDLVAYVMSLREKN